MKHIFLLFSFFIVILPVAALNVIDYSTNHAVGNLSGVNATYTTTLSGITLSNYDAIYVDEHTGDFFTGYETAVRNAMMNGLNIIAEYTNNTILGKLSTIFEFSTTLTTTHDANVMAAFSVTTEGANHPLFTGEGISGGGTVDVPALNRGSRSKGAYNHVPDGAQLLAKTGTSPLIMIGNVGLGTFVLINVENLEGGPTADEQTLSRNALFFADEIGTLGAVPEASSFILLGLAIAGIFGYKKFN